MTGAWSFRPMLVTDLDELMPLQERGAVAGLAQVFPQGEHPFPHEALRVRWAGELDDTRIAAYVACDTDGRLVGFAARRGDELLHFGTALETWGSGLAPWLHDRLLATYPPHVTRLRLRVFADNGRARRLYERLGWQPTGQESRSTFAPRPVLVEYALDL